MSDQAKGMTECACGDSYPNSSYDAGFIDGSGLCVNCDATLGVDIPSRQGEIDRLKAELEQYKRDAERMREALEAISFAAVDMMVPRSAIRTSALNALSAQPDHVGEANKKVKPEPKCSACGDSGILGHSTLCECQQQPQGCGACGDACNGKQCRVKEESPPADNWLDLAHELESVGLRYWKAADRERNKGAVKWIKNEETGFMAVVTRGEYSCELKAFCESLPFYSEQQAEVKP